MTLIGSHNKINYMGSNNKRNSYGIKFQNDSDGPALVIRNKPTHLDQIY
jgi:hypothetical protein